MRSPRHRAGLTLLELLCVLSIIALAAGIVAPRVLTLLDTIAVRGAVADADATLAIARHLAIARAARVTVGVDTAAGTLVLATGSDTLRRRDVHALYGVALAASRPLVTYAASGLALGGSNLTLVVRRRAVAETLTVSRLGRVRR